MNQKNSILLSAIVAYSENHAIGLNNQLPWHLPADLQHFKKITTGHPILMGRKTYESIGRPLPNRTNIILTRSKGLKIEGCEIVNTVEQALDVAHKVGAKELFVIGGSEIYHQLLPRVDQIYLTIVHNHFEGDSYFPVLAKDQWLEVSRERHLADEKNKHDYSFVVLRRK